jgi:formate dehydrogenase subunit gamma
MPPTRTQTKAGPPIRILRFDRVQRAAHWANALLFGILMATALPLYFGSLADVVGRRHLVAQIHLWAGIALPIPMIVSLLGPWGARMRRDVRRINRWRREEISWLRSRSRVPTELDKFNPGQKLNAIFTSGAIVIMLATGSVLQWFRFFPVTWRTGATFVHDVLAFTIFVVVFGHILFAVTHPESMRSMIKGWVTESWAARHAAAWLKEDRPEASVAEKSAGGGPPARTGDSGTRARPRPLTR